MPNVKPHILRWARETAGFALKDAVKKLDINDARGVAACDRLEAIEAGEVSPTRAMLVKMAKRYRRPLITFYLDDIPRTGDRGEDFRTLAYPVEQAEAGFVDAVVRDIRVRQDLFRAGLEATGEYRRLSYIASIGKLDNTAEVITSIEKTLGFDRAVFRSSSRNQTAFEYARELAENIGIYVLLVDNLGSWHTTISVESFRGFAISDDLAPFVAINANDSPSAWSFTLMHELAHLWIGATGVSGGIAENAIERFCNDVAAEILLPSQELHELGINETTPLETAQSQITDFADSRNVSSTLVAYRLHRTDAFDFARYRELEEFYLQSYRSWKKSEQKKRATSESGPSFYTVRKHRVGGRLLRSVEQMLEEGTLSTTKAAKILGVGAHNVRALLERGHS